MVGKPKANSLSLKVTVLLAEMRITEGTSYGFRCCGIQVRSLGLLPLVPPQEAETTAGLSGRSWSQAGGAAAAGDARGCHPRQ